MYLKQLYTQHKGWFLFVVLFIIGQLFINFKRGVAFSPFFHYGMYSERMELKDSIVVAGINVNHADLEPFDYSAQTWDKLTLPLYYWKNVKQHDSLCYHDNAKRLLSKLHIDTKENDFENPSFNFNDWYRNYVESIVGNKVDHISFYCLAYPRQQFSSDSKPAFRFR